MPSTRDPNDVVNPGPGRLPAGTVPTSAFFVGGGGGSALPLIQAHIADTVDAHMASAIGVDPVYLATGEPILASAGGPIYGENVLDFIVAIKDLLPFPPNFLGYANPALPLSGVPTWSALSTAGGFTRSGTFIATHHIWPVGTANIQLGGNLFPADRGVLAIYYNTDGNYLNAAATSLIGALWLGENPAPIGVPGANFIETSRLGAQVDRIASGVGLDTVSLTWRLPYLDDYSAYPGAPYPDFSDSFYRYQLAQFLVDPYTFLGMDGSLLVVHWKEFYARTLAAIQPSQLAANLIQANCYSPAPVAGVFDGGDIETVNRHNFIVDLATAPIISTYTYGVPTGSTAPLSGIQHYDNHVGFTVTGSFQITNLFYRGYRVGAVNPPDVPAGFGSDAIVKLSFAPIGGGDVEYGYYDLVDGSAVPFGVANPPESVDTANRTLTTVAPPVPAAYTPDGGVGSVSLIAYNPGSAAVTDTGPYGVLFNSYPPSGPSTLSTEEFEPFVDEKYRYISAYSGAATNPPLIPAGGDVFVSATVLAADDGALQLIGHRVVYPGTDYSTGFVPVGADYAAVRTADSAGHIRRYVRMLNTGIARNIGKLRIRGLAAADFQATIGFTGNEGTDHPGGAILQLKVPGVTGWLDLGRVKGDPDLATTDGRGCRTSLEVSGSDLILGFDTTAYTADNGSGDFPLILRIGLIKNGLGEALEVHEVEWQVP